jgi:hypothetical protein
MPAQTCALPFSVRLHGSRSSVDFSFVAWGELLMLLGPLGPPQFHACRALLLGELKQQWLSVLACKWHAKGWQHVSMGHETLACAHSPCPVPLPAVLLFAIKCQQSVTSVEWGGEGDGQEGMAKRGAESERQQGTRQEARAFGEGQEACHLKG